MPLVKIYTIGHSNHSWKTFAKLLQQNDIELLVDVRSNPVSRFAPFANKRTLPGLLKNIGIDYEFKGDALGGKPSDDSKHDAKGKPDYREMRETEAFREAIVQLVRLASNRKTVVLCSEEDPTQCHRLNLLGPALNRLILSSPELEIKDSALSHIRADGRVQSTDQLLAGKRSKKYGQQLQGTLQILD